VDGGTHTSVVARILSEWNKFRQLSDSQGCFRFNQGTGVARGAVWRDSETWRCGVTRMMTWMCNVKLKRSCLIHIRQRPGIEDDDDDDDDDEGICRARHK